MTTFNNQFSGPSGTDQFHNDSSLTLLWDNSVNGWVIAAIRALYAHNWHRFVENGLALEVGITGALKG